MMQRVALAIWIRAVFYLLIVGTGWLIVLPLLLLSLAQGGLALPLRPPPFLFIGVGVFGLGAALALVAGYYLITRGRGTPLPLDPPLELVTNGPYGYVRNPQAIAMLVMVIGETMLIQSWVIWLLLPLTVLYLEVIVGPWEERQLVARHGDWYLAYKAQVRKWVPRFK